VIFFAAPVRNAILEGDSDNINFGIITGPAIKVDAIELLSESETGRDGAGDVPINDTFVKAPNRPNDIALPMSILFTPQPEFGMNDSGQLPGHFHFDTPPPDDPVEIPIDFEDWTFTFRIHYNTTDDGKLHSQDASATVRISDTPEPSTLVMAMLWVGALGGVAIRNRLRQLRRRMLNK
jgi:hypothetical protein